VHATLAKARSWKWSNFDCQKKSGAATYACAVGTRKQRQGSDAWVASSVGAKSHRANAKDYISSKRDDAQRG
jgi:hypothetical protein